ncbi:MAG TPA: LuxR C-terminal-related transcriptional regulator [Chloroflexota bacterium]
MDWLLRTKLTPPPPRPGLVSRPRLIDLLADGLRRRLTLVSAPAGFGKTTLIAEYRSIPHPGGTGLPIGWVALDEGDNDPTRFWSYVVAGLQTLDPEPSDAALQMLRSPQPAPLDAVVATLIDDLSTLSEDVALVLDDYHVIESEAVHRSLTYLVEHLPPRLHLVLLSRTDPPLPLARLRARGHLVEVRAADLRFTSEEADRFLRETMGLELEPGDIAALEAGTEGWVAGLQLAALSLRGRPDPGAFIAGFAGSHRYVVDYLVEEVLQRLPARLQSFLTRTAVLDRLCGGLCDAVTGDGGGHATLELLERLNLFIVPLDEERRWYRYHHLFTGALRFRLRQTRPELLPELHLRAATWYEANGFLAEAVGHALAGDPERAADLIGRAADRLAETGQMATLRGWIESLPEELVQSRLGLCIAHAWTLLVDGDVERAAERVGQAERLVGAYADSADPASARGQILAVRAPLALVAGDVTAAIDLGHRALELLPPQESIGRGVTALTLGMAHQLQGDWAAAERAYWQAAQIGETTGSQLVRLSALGCVAELRAVHGELRRSAELSRQIVALASAGHQTLPLGAVGHIGLAHVEREWNRLESADAHVRAALALVEDTGVQVLVVESWLVQALIQRSRGDLAGATAAVAHAGEIARARSEPPGLSGSRERCHAVAARLAVERGDLDAARAWAAELGLTPDDRHHPLAEVDHAVFARLLLAEARAGHSTTALRDARALIERWGAASEAGGRLWHALLFRTLQVMAEELAGDRPAALASLARALALGEAEGFVRVFADEGAALAGLLADLAGAMRRGEPLAPPRRLPNGLPDEVDPDAGYTFALPDPAPAPLGMPSLAYVERVLAAAGGTVGSPVVHSGAHRPRQPIAEPLSDRELEVLALIAGGASNGEIAARLVVGMSTVKTHVNRIFRKLDADSRTQAVARARSLGLVG